MDFDNKNVAYDFSLFEEKTQKTEKQCNVLELPESNKHVKRRPKAKYKAIAVMLTFIVSGALVVGSMLYGQVQLNEVTDSINKITAELNELESVHTQLQVKVESKLSLGAVEEYARNNLRMDKINPYQIEYITLSTEDKGETHKDKINMFDKIHNSLHKE